MHLWQRMIRWLSVVAGVTLLLGCGARTEYRVEVLRIAQQGWDTLAVQVSFVEHTTLGGAKPAIPDDIQWLAFDATYDTLYSGSGDRIPFIDANLGDRERVMVEVCGRFGAFQVCEQEAVLASPKRIQLASELDYPDGTAYTKGRYHFRFQVERQIFGNESWEPIWPERPPESYMVASTLGMGKTGVTFPISGKRGRFNLERLPNSADFQYYLKSQLQDEQQAKVEFKVFAQLRAEPVYLTTIERVIRRKTDAERAYEVAFFADQIARRLLDKLQVDVPEQRVYAYIDDWTYEADAEQYQIDLEIVWKGTSWRARKYVLYGRLDVAETGYPATFTCTRCNRHADRLWRRYQRSDSIALDSLRTVKYVDMENRDNSIVER